MARIGASGSGGAFASGTDVLTHVQLMVGGDATGSATTLGTYTTIQSALSAIPNGTNSTDVRKVYTVLIPPGTYDEDLTVDITNCHINLVALGPVNIGLFDTTFWAATNARSITINCTAANIDSIRSTLGISTYVPNGTAAQTHASYSNSFRISGNVVYGTMPGGFTDTELYLNCEVFGNLDSSAFATHNFHMFLNRARVRGTTSGTRNLIQGATECNFSGLVTCRGYSVIRNCSIAGGMTVSQATSGGYKPFGMVGTDIAGTFTGPALSFVVDSTTSYYFTTLNGGSFAGGASITLLENVSGSSGITQLTGDVTAGPGSGSVAATIAANAVTNAKLAQMAASTVKANITGGTANPTDAALSSTATNNSIVQRTASADIVATVMRSATFKPIDGAGTAATFTGGSAASAGAGGNSTISGAAGDGTGAGGAGGNVTITGANAGGDNTQNNTGGSVTINNGTSKGSSAGGGLTVNGGVGGPGTATAGATGGTHNINGGTGGIGSATSGSGGNATLKAGTGGAGTAGGNGGTATLNGGTAGVGSASAGNGGPANVSGGSSGAFAGSAGGSVSLVGAGGTSTTTGGAGGAATVTGGNAGGDQTVNQNGGSVTITSGTSKGSANGAAMNLNVGAGGTGTASTGATGGAFTLTAGAGGANATTSGAGGGLNFVAGVGGSTGTPGAGGEIIFKTAATTSAVEVFRLKNNGDAVHTTGNINIATVGKGLVVKSGANSRIGQATLVAGTVVVSNTSVTANSRIFLTVSAAGGTQGFLRTTKSANTSFTITSTSGTETSTVDWLLVESQ